MAIISKKRFLSQHSTCIFLKNKSCGGSPKGIEECAVNQNPTLWIVFEETIIFSKISAPPFCFFKKKELVLGSIECAQYSAASTNYKSQIVFEKQVTQKKSKKISKIRILKKGKMCWVELGEYNKRLLCQFLLRLIFSKIITFRTWKYIFWTEIFKNENSEKWNVVLSCARQAQQKTLKTMSTQISIFKNNQTFLKLEALFEQTFFKTKRTTQHNFSFLEIHIWKMSVQEVFPSSKKFDYFGKYESERKLS